MQYGDGAREFSIPVSERWSHSSPHTFLWSMSLDCVQEEGLMCPEGYFCAQGEWNPNFGTLSFDTSPEAWSMLAQIVTLDSWTLPMYMLDDTTSGSHAIYFVMVVLVGGFFLTRLLLALLALEFVRGMPQPRFIRILEPRKSFDTVLGAAAPRTRRRGKSGSSPVPQAETTKLSSAPNRGTGKGSGVSSSLPVWSLGHRIRFEETQQLRNLLAAQKKQQDRFWKLTEEFLHHRNQLSLDGAKKSPGEAGRLSAEEEEESEHIRAHLGRLQQSPFLVVRGWIPNHGQLAAMAEESDGAGEKLLSEALGSWDLGLGEEAPDLFGLSDNRFGAPTDDQAYMEGAEESVVVISQLQPCVTCELRSHQFMASSGLIYPSEERPQLLTLLEEKKSEPSSSEARSFGFGGSSTAESVSSIDMARKELESVRRFQLVDPVHAVLHWSEGRGSEHAVSFRASRDVDFVDIRLVDRSVSRLAVILFIYLFIHSFPLIMWFHCLWGGCVAFRSSGANVVRELARKWPAREQEFRWRVTNADQPPHVRKERVEHLWNSIFGEGCEVCEAVHHSDGGGEEEEKNSAAVCECLCHSVPAESEAHFPGPIQDDPSPSDGLLRSGRVSGSDGSSGVDLVRGKKERVFQDYERLQHLLQKTQVHRHQAPDRSAWDRSSEHDGQKEEENAVGAAETRSQALSSSAPSLLAPEQYLPPLEEGQYFVEVRDYIDQKLVDRVRVRLAWATQVARREAVERQTRVLKRLRKNRKRALKNERRTTNREDLLREQEKLASINPLLRQDAQQQALLRSLPAKQSEASARPGVSVVIGEAKPRPLKSAIKLPPGWPEHLPGELSSNAVSSGECVKAFDSFKSGLRQVHPS